ncbi:hypothetical protein EVAR_49907_1 [Eumeta japonica]|uniref:Uncharacterized protein n=1 Tax=Eumeta variegata TaxID=151549 RepID=A0A4C1Y5I5_EUMVA|nr:hypothetical protein EVAR_49907_1 [Eumeta japonica]
MQNEYKASDTRYLTKGDVTFSCVRPLKKIMSLSIIGFTCVWRAAATARIHITSLCPFYSESKSSDRPDRVQSITLEGIQQSLGLLFSERSPSARGRPPSARRPLGRPPSVDI